MTGCHARLTRPPRVLVVPPPEPGWEQTLCPRCHAELPAAVTCGRCAGFGYLKRLAPGQVPTAQADCQPLSTPPVAAGGTPPARP